MSVAKKSAKKKTTRKSSKKKTTIIPPITSDYLQNLHKDLCYGIFDVDENSELSDEEPEIPVNKDRKLTNKFKLHRILIGAGILIIVAYFLMVIFF